MSKRYLEGKEKMSFTKNILIEDFFRLKDLFKVFFTAAANLKNHSDQEILIKTFII